MRNPEVSNEIVGNETQGLYTKTLETVSYEKYINVGLTIFKHFFFNGLYNLSYQWLSEGNQYE